MNTRGENWLLWKKGLFVASFAFCVITFEPIEVHTCSAPQNDRLNLSLVKENNVDGGKLARNGRKMTILAGLWGRLWIGDEYEALLWRLFDKISQKRPMWHEAATGRERERETCWSCNSRKVAFQLVLYWRCTVVTMARTYLFCPKVTRHFYFLDQ